ncbi:hypothetical protein ABEB36_002582 [Hypothenemus hampei]
MNNQNFDQMNESLSLSDVNNSSIKSTRLLRRRLFNKGSLKENSEEEKIRKTKYELENSPISKRKKVYESESNESSESEESNYEDFNPKESLEEIRRRNKERMAAVINTLRNSDLEQQFDKTNRELLGKSVSSAPIKRRRKRQNGNRSIRDGALGTLMKPRRSDRLQGKKPMYDTKALENINENLTLVYVKYYKSDFVEKLKHIAHESKQSTSSGIYKAEPRKIIPVEKVTQEMLNNIVTIRAMKKPSPTGTICHQCRLRTSDQKTCCRNPSCVGNKGNVCGYCLKKR